MLNVTQLQGRFTATPELQTANNTEYVAFNIASQRDQKRNGETITDFIPCIAFGNGAKFIAKHFTKGDMILIHGRMQSRPYTDKNGNNRTSYELYVINSYFCGVKPANCPSKSFADDYESINWDEIPDLPSEF